MSKLIDLTGQRFGNLTVIERYKDNTKDGHAQWLCQCDCGKTAIYASNVLKRGKAISCGCKKIRDLTGQRFGKLIALEYAYSKNKNRYWKCQCDCGAITYVTTSSLVTGNTKSCGCLHSETVINNNIILKSKIDQSNIIGMHFGYLEVIELINRTNQSIYKCYCHNCGNYKNIKYSDLVSGRIHGCGCLSSWGEAQLKTLLAYYDINYSSQYKFNDLKSEKGVALRFDFAIFKQDSLYCLIEYQGDQHFNTHNPYWTPTLEQNDELKRQYCKQNNIILYEITKDTDLEKFIQELSLILIKED